MEVEYTHKKRNYDLEDYRYKAVKIPTKDDHPLLEKYQKTGVEHSKVEGNVELEAAIFDPLGAIGGAPSHPLSSPAPPSSHAVSSEHKQSKQANPAKHQGEAEDSRLDISQNKQEPTLNEDERRVNELMGVDIETDPWQKIRNKIEKHSDKTISEDASIELLEETEQTIKREITLGKGKSRLEQLERRAPKKIVDTTTLTKREYRKQMKILYKEMHSFWKKKDKVTCLKIVIQCSKLLNTIESASFYPEKFIGITDLYDLFSQFVFDRIKSLAFNPENKATIDVNTIPDSDIKPNAIPDNAKNICTNWFLKTSCIREVLPRCYIELSLCRCYHFISETPISETLERIAKTIGGVSHSLPACYLGMYLAKVGFDINPNLKSHLLILTEMLFKTFSHSIEKGYPGVTKDEYFHCLEMGLEWIVHCLCYDASEPIFKEVMRLYKESAESALGARPEYLQYIIAHSPEDLISTFGKPIMDLFKPYSGNSEIKLIRELAIQFCKKPPLSKKLRLQFMEYGWGKTKEANDGVIYMQAACALTEFAIKFLKIEKVEFLHEIFLKFKSFILPDHGSKNKAHNETLYRMLEGLLLKIILSASAVAEMLSIDTLLPLFDYFNDQVKRKLCQMIMDTFVRSEGKISDLIHVNTLFGIGRVLHDSVDFLANEEEQKKVGELLTLMINKIDFGRDLEQELKILSEARGLFFNFDSVMEVLIYKVLECAVKALRFAKFRHNRKTLAFVKACISYSNISIPSLDDQVIQLKLFIKTGEIALLNGLISEADSLCKNTISVVNQLLQNKDADKRAEHEIIVEPVIHELFGFLVVVPGNPETGAHHFIERIYKRLRDHTWSTPRGVFIQFKLFLTIISYICTSCQEKLPYHVLRVDSNDTLFINDQKYLSVAKKILNDSIQQILECAGKLDEMYGQTSDLENLNNTYNCLLRAANVLMICTKSDEKGKKIIQKFITLADKYLNTLVKLEEEAGEAKKKAGRRQKKDGKEEEKRIIINKAYVKNTLDYYKKTMGV